MTDDRAPFREARTVGLQQRHQQRVERADEQLVKAAYDEAKEEFLMRLESRINERDHWIQEATAETRGFWLKMRARGLPDRPAEREAYQRLADDIRAIGAEETP